MLRAVIAFLLAPFPAAVFQAMIVGIWPKDGMGVFEHPVSMFVAICLLFYIFGVVLGLPMLWLARKNRPETSYGYAVGGATVILLPIMIALVWIAIRGQLSVYVASYNIIFFAVGGASAGVLFYLIKQSGRRLTV